MVGSCGNNERIFYIWNQKKVSIIVPVYKVEKFLERCVESIIKQTYQNIEIILIDDESPDECPKMCDQYEIKDNRIKVIHKKKWGTIRCKECRVRYSIR
ncbi:MAG: glycosyltransferase family 2 protein [Lachnospiraceae bacterium]